MKNVIKNDYAIDKKQQINVMVLENEQTSVKRNLIKSSEASIEVSNNQVVWPKLKPKIPVSARGEFKSSTRPEIVTGIITEITGREEPIVTKSNDQVREPIEFNSFVSSASSVNDIELPELEPFKTVSVIDKPRMLGPNAISDNLNSETKKAYKKPPSMFMIIVCLLVALGSQFFVNSKFVQTFMGKYISNPKIVRAITVSTALVLSGFIIMKIIGYF